MNTIPNVAPDMNARVLSPNEVKDLVTADDFVWVELKGWFGKDNDEVFHLRVAEITDDVITFREPHDYWDEDLEDYNYSWRIWNICPTCDNGEKWEGDEK